MNAADTGLVPVLIDRRALTEDLLAIGRESGLTDTARREAVLGRLKQALETGRSAAREFLEAGPKLSPARLGMRAARGLSDHMDAIVSAAFTYASEIVFPRINPTSSERLSVVAVGGYGRGALAPGSDVDLLFVLPYKQTPWGESVVEFMLYILWDIGLKVGHATRPVADSIAQARKDYTIRTSLLEARYLCGDDRLYKELRQKFQAEFGRANPADFIEAKLAEREARHERSGGSRYQVEPNLKDGKGGLRDIQTLLWIGKYVYRVESARDLVSAGLLTAEECETFEAAEAFLFEVRLHLHFIAGRAEEKLSFDRQLDLADRLGFIDGNGRRGVERFMKRYFTVAKDVGDLTRIILAALEDQQKKRWPSIGRLFGWTGGRLPHAGFRIESNRVHVTDSDIFIREPLNLIRLFWIADRESLLIHPGALKLASRAIDRIDDALRADARANQLFLEILTSPRDPERILRRMNEAGVLGAFIPDFGRIVAMMQFNMYHHFTVDEHLLRAIGNLSRIERGELAQEHPLANEIVHKIQSRAVLYLAAFLHDIAKGRERDHSEAGGEIARVLGPRLGLSAAETDTVAWLVEQHLVMSTYAQSRDPTDAKTIDDFVKIVQSPERLRLLLILTVADIRAVGPGVWNGWKGELLRTLYYEAESSLHGGHSREPHLGRIEERRSALAQRLADWPAEAVERMLKRHAPAYWLGLDGAMHEAHARLARAADEAGRPFDCLIAADGFRSVSALTVYAADAPGLFARMAGTISSVGASIQDAKAFTTHDGMALDVFWIQDSENLPLRDEAQIERLRKRLADAAAGRFDPGATARPARRQRRLEAFAFEPEIIIDNEASHVLTVIEIAAQDRPGLLFDLARTLSEESLRISSAHIATFGERAIDVFYVKDQFGLKAVHPVRLQRIKERLVHAASGIPQAPQE